MTEFKTTRPGTFCSAGRGLAQRSVGFVEPELDLSDARYIFRWRWVDEDVALAMFP